MPLVLESKIGNEFPRCASLLKQQSGVITKLAIVPVAIGTNGILS